MTMDHAALLEVLEAMKSAGVNDRVKTAAQTMYQALIEAEATAVIGAGRWERTEEPFGAPQWVSASGVLDCGRGFGAGDPEAAVGVVSSRRCWNGAVGWIRRLRW